MGYRLKNSKELKINKNKRPKILIQRWGDAKPLIRSEATLRGDHGYLLNILEWNEEDECFESKYNLNIIDEDPLSQDSWSFEYCDNRKKQ